MKTFAEKLESTNGIADIFELVKDGVRKVDRMSRAGLTLGLAELASRENYFVGAFYPVGSNIIVMNKLPIRRILETDSALFKPYAFHILLHEYLHSLGYLDEQLTRDRAYQISRELFGEEHLATRIALNLGEFLPNVTYPLQGEIKEEGLYVEMVRDFDKSNTEYIM